MYDKFDVTYPPEQYIPKGPQHVPPIRGYVLEASETDSLFFEASRVYRVQKATDPLRHVLNSIRPGFLNPFIQYPLRDGYNDLATIILTHRHYKSERGIDMVTRAERQALEHLQYKPDHVEYLDFLDYIRNYY